MHPNPNLSCIDEFVSTFFYPSPCLTDEFVPQHFFDLSTNQGLRSIYAEMLLMLKCSTSQDILFYKTIILLSII
jgi:hypothetical protein